MTATAHLKLLSDEADDPEPWRREEAPWQMHEDAPAIELVQPEDVAGGSLGRHALPHIDGVGEHSDIDELESSLASQAVVRPPENAPIYTLLKYLIRQRLRSWWRVHGKSTVHTCEFGAHCGRLFCRGLPRGRAQQLLRYEQRGGVLGSHEETALRENGHRP